MDASITATPARIVALPPNLPANKPESGASANMPTMWTVSTKPIAPKPWPKSCIWSGAMVITATIATWPVAMAVTATSTTGRWLARCTAPVPGFRCGSAGLPRGISIDTAAAPMAVSSENRYGPLLAGSPTEGTAAVLAGMRFGPISAPMVPAHMIVASTALRRRAGYRSAAR